MRFRWTPVASAEDEDEDTQLLFEARRQMSLLEEASLTPLPKPEYLFRYEFESAGRRHVMTIHDWEAQATYAHYKRRYGGPSQALEKMAEYYEDRMATMNPHLFVGNMKKRPRQFILIGVLRSPAIQTAEMQHQLF
ncbi:hypothetical protein D779_2967 [Imhoffiella purpurea]|uniref:Uncharacterized protein n=1 Tax=Imhoffiella purpurea TaxID=1249627 RepID=W9V3R0_9GAMM|nr:hypothetical protein D779_2967 [Imhoffiella purpurea]